MKRNISRISVSALISVMIFTGCDKIKDAGPHRTFRMGFQASAPRFDDFDLILKSISMWVANDDAADAAMITTEVPWTALLEGKTAVDYVKENYVGLVDYYRQHNLKLWAYIDPANGLNRSIESQGLIDAGKSIVDEDVQAMYRRFVVVMDSLLKPDHIGLALETNLIRESVNDDLYNAIRKAANDAAAELKSRNSTALLSISVQCDIAWGGNTTSGYKGITQDLLDFHFIQELGISSYSYFYREDPKDIPKDYYSKIASDANMPVFVSEGGWPSEWQAFDQNSQPFETSELEQVSYYEKQVDLLNEANATAMFSLTFTDIDLDALPPNVPLAGLFYFAHLGVVDKDLKPKPAFEKWKEIFRSNFTGQ